MRGVIAHPVERVPPALRRWAEPLGFLAPGWEWALVQGEDVVPLHDQDAYRWEQTLLKHIATVDEVHYYAGRRYPCSRVYWTAFRLWWDLSPEELLAS